MAGTGFAFSSAPGANDRLINDTLGNRFKEAIAKKLFPEMTISNKKDKNGKDKTSQRSGSQHSLRSGLD